MKNLSLSLLLLSLHATPALPQDWGTAEPSEVGLDAARLGELAQRIRSQPETNIHGILVARRGQLVFEEYFRGQDEDWGNDLGVIDHHRNQHHDLRSVSKSVTSALVGIAIAEGKIPDVKATAFELFPEHTQHLAPDKRALTLHHILSMSAGLDWFEPFDYTNQGNDEIRMINSPDPVVFTLGRSLATEPGERFQYNGGLPTLLGYLLERGYGEKGDEILRTKLLEPLGISSFDFRANASGLLAYASGMRLRPRDMLKIGQLYLDGGKWQGRQILPADWVEASLTSYHSTPGTAGYGYQWWLHRYVSEQAGVDMWIPMASGNGGQRIVLVRPLDMVVVITAGNYNRTRVPLGATEIMTDYVLPAAGLNGMETVLAKEDP